MGPDNVGTEARESILCFRKKKKVPCMAQLHLHGPCSKRVLERVVRKLKTTPQLWLETAAGLQITRGHFQSAMCSLQDAELQNTHVKPEATAALKIISPGNETDHRVLFSSTQNTFLSAKQPETVVFIPRGCFFHLLNKMTLIQNGICMAH